MLILSRKHLAITRKNELPLERLSAKCSFDLGDEGSAMGRSESAGSADGSMSER
jgi:hypothetical protein